LDAIFMNTKSICEPSGSDACNRFQLRQAASGRGASVGGSRVAAGQLRVLIVDNDRDGANMTATLVSLWGHYALCAYDGVTGLALASAATPDVVLLDIAMPKMDGCQMAVQLRQTAGLKECFLIAVTGLGEEKNRRRCQEAGIDLFLVKPVDPLVMETLLMLERQRLALSRAPSIIIDAKSRKSGAAQQAALV
jgi:CheY-like chemotaxis protein